MMQRCNDQRTIRRASGRMLLVACLGGVLLVLAMPLVASAHAILLRSDPAKDAALRSAPREVRMWFSEDLNPVISTAAVLNAQSLRIDHRDARVSPDDSREMDLSLPPDLPPGPYLVLWRTGSADDGHTLRGSFLFTIANPDGLVPASQGITAPKQDPLGGNYTSVGSGGLDGPTLFLFAMITLVDLGATFWGGAVLWLALVHRRVRVTEPIVQQAVAHRFDRRFALPVLLLLLVANIGVLAGQGLGATGGSWLAALSPDLLTKLATSSRFGHYWLLREGVLLVAILAATLPLVPMRSLGRLRRLLPWINLGLAALLFFAMSMSSHASAVTPALLPFAVIIDWLHLVGAALWVGGMLFIATTYLPVLSRQTMAERARALVMVLPRYSLLAIAGVVLMAVTGPFSATFHLQALDQFLTTAYGRTLAVKIALVCALLLTSAFHVGLLRPRLKKEQQKYAYAAHRLQALGSGKPGPLPSDGPAASQEGVAHTTTISTREEKRVAELLKLREQRLTAQTRRLVGILRFEPLLGVGVLLCVGLMNVFAGTLTPLPAQPPATTTARPVQSTTKTTDGLFSVTLSVSPNRFGPNTFTVHLVDARTGRTVTQIGVSLYTTMLDMDMGTDSINLQPDGKGNFTALGDLGMAGRWQVREVVRTPDNRLHSSTVTFSTAA
jgi:copper transport protein